MEGKLILIIALILAISNLYSNLKEVRKNNKFNKWNILDIIYFGFLIVVLVINN